VIHTIEKIDSGTRTLRMVEKNYFFPYEEDTLLTQQEKNVLKYLADGLSSKMITDRMGITENTIANHRKNMLRKTNTKNVAQLIAFSIRNGII
jgi:DNA-binding CsgD family transcriptional regulator